MLAALAKNGRQDDTAAFEAFDAYQSVMGTAAKQIDDSSEPSQPMTAAAPAADAPPSINAFRAASKSESAAQAKYKRAASTFHHDHRDEERAAEVSMQRALQASIAQTQQQQLDDELRRKIVRSCSECVDVCNKLSVVTPVSRTAMRDHQLFSSSARR